MLIGVLEQEVMNFLTNFRKILQNLFTFLTTLATAVSIGNNEHNDSKRGNNNDKHRDRDKQNNNKHKDDNKHKTRQTQ